MKKQLSALALSISLSVCCALSMAACETNPQGAVSDSDRDSVFGPWDSLGGGGEGTASSVSGITADTYAPKTDVIAVSDEQKQTDASSATKIDLSALPDLAASSFPAGTTFENNTLSVFQAGVYLLTGELRGNVEVADCAGTVRLILGGATIRTQESQLCAAIVFKKTDSLRILTIADGTVNTLADSAGDTDASGDSAVIQAKKTSLTVNGAGKLILQGNGENATGIKVKKALTLSDATVEITVPNNGIKADEKLLIYNANIMVAAGGDGIKTDMEATAQTDANAYAADPVLGYIYVKNSSFDITAGDDGFSANNGMYFDNGEDDTVKIKTNGGAPSAVTETSSDNADGKGIKTDGITLTDGDTETDIPAAYEENYSLVIAGGKFDVDSNDDALSSKGNLIVAGGDIAVKTGDDGVHAEYLTQISGGKVDVEKCYEGVEGAKIEILGGEVAVISVDDGINAANGDLKTYDFSLYIGGGKVFVNAQGDGVDSNGSVTVTGGRLIVYGPTARDNGSLDSEKGFIVNGGDILAVGSNGMVETPASNSSQCYLSINLSSAQAAGTEISVYDSENTLLDSITPTKSYQSVIISLSSFVKGSSYTVKIGSAAYTATLQSIGTALGGNASGGGNQGFNPGWDRPGGR